MNVDHLLIELELATWESAEAEAHERMAMALRVKSAKRMAFAHAEIRAATTAAKSARSNSLKTNVLKTNSK